MMKLTFPVTPAGLAVPVLVGWSGSKIATAVAASQPVASPVPARGLLDTGSDVSVVASWILQRLALSKIVSSSSTTTGGRLSVDLFDVCLEISDPARPAGPWLTSSDLRVIEMTTVLPDTDVLIGLDVLLECGLHLDGPAKQFTLEF
jgi:hypothetical protein